MKYVLMFTSTEDMSGGGDTEQSQALYKRVYEWFQEHGAAGKIADGGAELHPVSTATTVRHGDEGPVVVDGPFNEAKEVIGGVAHLHLPATGAPPALPPARPPPAPPRVVVGGAQGWGRG